EVWQSLPQQLGAATGRGAPQTAEQGGYQVVMVPLMYEGGVILAQTAIDAEGRIAGFLLQPAQPAQAPGQAPPAPPEACPALRAPPGRPGPRRLPASCALAPGGMRHSPARMRGQPQVLFNTGEIEIWPRGLLRARGNHDARVLARARHVLRRKRDGRYLA